MSFDTWLLKCDAIIAKQFGVGLSDLEDWEWMGAFEDGATPAEAVAQFKEDIGEEF